jgi:drug/metabolite transporter (DMT)-like permease
MELWIPITIAAAFLQNLRSALQKHIKGRLSTVGAAYARFLYAWPFALLYVAGLHRIGGLAWPEPNGVFLLYCLLGGVSQILFTVLLLWMFSFRSFAVGTTFSKLEVIMVAGLSAAILGDGLTATAVLAVGLSAVGVICLSMNQAHLTIGALWSGLIEKPTLIGLLSAASLGASSVFYRGGALALGDFYFPPVPPA